MTFRVNFGISYDFWEMKCGLSRIHQTRWTGVRVGAAPHLWRFAQIGWLHHSRAQVILEGINYDNS